MTEFGINIRIALLKLGKTRKWLVEQVKEKTDLFFDDAYLWRIEHGQRKPEKIVTAIKEILEI